MTVETMKFRGRPAAPGLAAGPLARNAADISRVRVAGSPETERAALQEAIARSASDLAALAASQTREAADILEFQIAMLEDEDLHGPAFREIDSGASAAQAWERALDAQIADYAAAEDAYFRGRTADLSDLRDRVCRALAGEGQARLELPNEAILVADDLAPSRFLEIEPARLSGIALTAGSPSGHVAMLARARGVPMVVGLGSIPAVAGELALLDGERGEIEISPSPSRVAEWRRDIAALAERRAHEARLAEAPAMTSSGRRILALVNLQNMRDLTPEAAHADGVGLVRTEFLFEPGRAPPDETTQYEAYRRVLQWARAACHDPHPRRRRRQAHPRHYHGSRSEPVSR